MHEMALTHNVLDTVLEYAKRADAKKVGAVYLKIGYARDIVDDLFNSCFKYLAKGTIAADAQLVVCRIPVTVRCNQCGKVYPMNIYRPASRTCPFCKACDYTPLTGMEFTIDRIDIASDEVRQPELTV